jgi:epoxyqueuosine reductase
VHTRHYGDIFNDGLRRTVQQHVRDSGVSAVAPVVSCGFRVLRGVPGGPTSTWSERHAAYAAGLGTFGLCDGFLTPVGKAMRCGSVVVTLDLSVDPRPFGSHIGACPYLVDGSCGECIKRCPVGAIGPNGHDKAKCEAFQEETLLPLRERYGVSITGCGLCQTGVPCESALPERESALVP